MMNRSYARQTTLAAVPATDAALPRSAARRPEGAAPLIQLQRVTKVFNAGQSNAFTAIEQIDLEICTASVTALVGPSGSGKTTLLSLIGCMMRPTAGLIHVNGRQTSSLPEKFLAEVRRTTFGFIFQDHNLIRGISVLENILLPAYPAGEPYKRLRPKAMALLWRLGIDGKAHRPIESLSGGERQRVTIARALINDPDVILADEPTAHLDTALSVEFLDIAAELAAEGKTLLVASHDPLVFNAALVDRVVRMRDGRINEGEPLK